MSCLVASPVAGCVEVSVAISCSLSIPIDVCQRPSYLPRLTNFSLARLAAVHNSVENDVAHLIRERFGVAIDSRVIPGVDPIDHAEDTHHGSTGVEIEASTLP